MTRTKIQRLMVLVMILFSPGLLITYAVPLEIVLPNEVRALKIVIYFLGGFNTQARYVSSLPSIYKLHSLSTVSQPNYVSHGF